MHDFEKLSALFRHVEEGNIQKVAALLASGDITVETKRSGETALDAAVIFGQLEMVRMLLDRGFRSDEVDSSEWAPLHHASWNDHVEVAKLLIERGAPLEATDATGWTPLAVAVLGGSFLVVAHLLSAGANPDVNVPDSHKGRLFNRTLSEILIQGMNNAGKDSSPENLGDELKKYEAIGILLISVKVAWKGGI